MSFNKIIGQKVVINSLKNCIRNNKVSHAYIFEGPEGIGKKTIASLLASALTCERKGTDPCGVCKSCIQNKSGNHPDVKFLHGETGSIGVDMIRDLQKDMYIKPYSADKKIYIISEADKMTLQAQNSLLKVLEEPPAYGMFILTTINASLLLKTILSRSVVLRFAVHPYEEIEEFLKNEYPGLGEEVSVIARLSGGIIGRAKDVAESQEFRTLRRDIFNRVYKLLSPNKAVLIDAADYFIEYKQSNRLLLDFLLSWFRDVLIIKESHDKKKVINIDMIDNIYEFALNVTSYSICKIIEIIMDTKKKIDMNVNYALAIETMFIRSWEEIHGNGGRSTV
ncbi:MAG: DNA polymerase III subunit delta' [Clostridiaceae bacterium]|nr:DNA polymerase III subunit delta' [Clostridiaceae bacterium]